MSDIKSDFAAYTDQYGLVQNSSGWSGNGLLYTGEAIVALADNGALTPELIEQYKQAYNKCMVLNGLIERIPGYKDQEGPDDYHGCALASRYLGADIAQSILDYGKLNGADKWDASLEDQRYVTASKIIYQVLSLGGLRKIKHVYNNIHPGYFTLNSWVGRFPGLLATLKYSCNKTPTPLEFIFWAGGLIMGLWADQTNHDAWTLPWCSYRAALGRTILGWPVLKLWNWKFRKVWGNPGDLMAAYFQDPNHPNAVWLKKS